MKTRITHGVLPDTPLRSDALVTTNGRSGVFVDCGLVDGGLVEGGLEDLDELGFFEDDDAMGLRVEVDGLEALDDFEEGGLEGIDI